MLVRFCLCVNVDENAMTFNHSVVNNGKIKRYQNIFYCTLSWSLEGNSMYVIILTQCRCCYSYITVLSHEAGHHHRPQQVLN